MFFTPAKIAVFLSSVVVAVSAQTGTFFSASNCAGTLLQTVVYTDGLCVPSNGALSVLLQNQDPMNAVRSIFYTDLAHQDPSFEVDLDPGASECVNIPDDIQSPPADPCLMTRPTSSGVAPQNRRESFGTLGFLFAPKSCLYPSPESNVNLRQNEHMLPEDTAPSREASPPLEAGGGGDVERPQQSSRRRDRGRRRRQPASSSSTSTSTSATSPQPPTPVVPQQPQPQPQQPSSGGGQTNAGLKLRLDLNLEVDVQIKAKIHGDVTLSLM
ncbi:hypothetical protein C8R45DRAFT_1185161 [Mycena sanguinolenta]|nr:hypothetical protein C8R45DRAFT_1185161 [Mycena sanguinolenta]